MTNSTNSNTRPDRLFPELPPTKDMPDVGGNSDKAGGVYRVRASGFWSACFGVVAVAVRFIGQPLLRLPVMEFTVILVMLAMLLFSLG